MFRRVYVLVLQESELSTPRGAHFDAVLQRVSQQASFNQQGGVADAFLFVLCGSGNMEQAIESINRLAFSDAQIVTLPTKDEDGVANDWNYQQEQIARTVETWLNVHHPAAIADLYADGNDTLDLWWSGIEAVGGSWPFVEAYAATLPASHVRKAGTWLAILEEAFQLEMLSWPDEVTLTFYAAVLCEFLHGFEAASHNFCNDFDARSVCKALGVNDFQLGLILGYCTEGEAIDEMMYNAEVSDLDGLKTHALELAVEQERETVRTILSNFFGDDKALFWALYTTIWPKLEEPYSDAFDSLCNGPSWNDLAEINEAWEYVDGGSCNRVVMGAATPSSSHESLSSPDLDLPVPTRRGSWEFDQPLPKCKPGDTIALRVGDRVIHSFQIPFPPQEND